MIHVKRTAKPKALVDNELKWKDALEAMIDAKNRKKIADRYRHKTIQLALSAMFSGKCAYCEIKVEHISDAHIEHYRPKSRFPELTFDWENLLWACGKCNSIKYKGDKFPDATDDGPILNPCEDVPDEHLTFDYDPLTFLAHVNGLSNRGRITEILLGLNRTELLVHRSRRVKQLSCLARLGETDSEAKSLLYEASLADAEYSAFARVLL